MFQKESLTRSSTVIYYLEAKEGQRRSELILSRRAP